jgi:hypothetical protein
MTTSDTIHGGVQLEERLGLNLSCSLVNVRTPRFVYNHEPANALDVSTFSTFGAQVDRLYSDVASRSNTSHAKEVGGTTSSESAV